MTELYQCRELYWITCRLNSIWQLSGRMLPVLNVCTLYVLNISNLKGYTDLNWFNRVSTRNIFYRDICSTGQSDIQDSIHIQAEGTFRPFHNPANFIVESQKITDRRYSIHQIPLLYIGPTFHTTTQLYITTHRTDKIISTIDVYY